MKKLTEIDLQNALDECAEIKFKSHGEWLAGMVKRLNAVLTEDPNEFLKSVGKALRRKEDPFIPPPIKTVIQSGNVLEPEVPCIS